MAAQSQRWVTLILSCVVVTVFGLGIVAVAPTLHDSAASTSSDQPGLQRGVSGDQRINTHQPIALAPDSFPLMPMDQMAMSRNSRFARYDNIVVEVKQDGTLRVLGERMEMEAFKLLLSEQMRDQLRTVVTIRPDGKCLFQHVGPVMTICREVGIPHQMEPRPAPDFIGPPPA